jgi:hypothetical protein
MACHPNAPVVGDTVWYCPDEITGDLQAVVVSVVPNTSNVNLTYQAGTHSASNVPYNAQEVVGTWGCSSSGGGGGFGRGGG